MEVSWSSQVLSFSFSSISSSQLHLNVALCYKPTSPTQTKHCRHLRFKLMHLKYILPPCQKRESWSESWRQCKHIQKLNCLHWRHSSTLLPPPSNYFLICLQLLKLWLWIKRYEIRTTELNISPLYIHSMETCMHALPCCLSHTAMDRAAAGAVFILSPFCAV